MHDAKQSTLSKINQGAKILVVEGPDKTFEFGRPKDPTAVVRSVTKISTVPDQWSGKVYTVQITGGRKNTGRYGTTHVYVSNIEAAAKPMPLAEVDTESGTKRVQVEPDGTVRVQGWTGGELVETTPHGKRIRIAADGVVTVIEDDGHERPAEIIPDEDEQPAPAPAVTDDEIANSDRCHPCKGFGVVRRRGPKVGKPYRTHAGAEAATANGNSETCPTCKGATLLIRTA